MEADIRFKQKFQSFKKALASLSQGINSNPLDSLSKEGIIHRFEYTWLLSWLTLKCLLRERGITAIGGHKEVIQEAGKLEILSNVDLWSEMHIDRNKGSYTCDEVLINELYEKIRSIYLPLFLALETTFENEQ